MRWIFSLVVTGTLLGGIVLVRADDPPRISDEAVDKAIRKAVEWLKSKRNASGHWESGTNTGDRYWTGDTGLALLALLYAGEDPREGYMSQSLDWLSAQTLKGTYTYGTRAHALALVPGKKYRSRLEEDLNWLTKAMHPKGTENAGSYGYESIAERPDGWYDNSNSQYGVLGVWMATDAGFAASENYWALIEDHWMTDQRGDGGWGYKKTDNSTGSMTAAGLATLFVVLDKAHAHDEGAFDGKASPLCGKHKEAGRLLSAIQRGLDWLGREYTPNNPHGEAQWRYYYLYGVERAGRASGRKYFRGRDWFREGATTLLAEQNADGSWGGTGEHMHDIQNTCFALMFLCHGRAPLMYGKLDFGPDSSNKLRDTANLTRYAQHSFERLLNWQIVDLEASLDDLMEAPVLYLTGHTAWQFSEVQIQKLREYCQRGGLILGVACCSNEAFNDGFKQLAQKMFPDYPPRPLPDKHPLFSGELQFPVKEAPLILEVHNGVRTLMLLSTKDICAPWNQYRMGKWEQYFQLGCNIYIYATDKTTIRSRLETPEIPQKQVETARTIKVARVKYNGQWDVEPYGWTRVARYMNNETASRVLVTTGVALDSPELQEFKVAYLTGTQAFELTAAEVAGLRKFLTTGGGTLLADAAGGSKEFVESLEKYLSEILKADPKYLPTDAAVLNGKGLPAGVDLSGIGYRRAARQEGHGQKYPRLKAYDVGRRLAAIYSPLDLSAGLLGTHIYNCRGYEADGALRVVRNMLLYAQLSTAEKARASKTGTP